MQFKTLIQRGSKASFKALSSSKSLVSDNMKSEQSLLPQKVYHQEQIDPDLEAFLNCDSNTITNFDRFMRFNSSSLKHVVLDLDETLIYRSQFEYDGYEFELDCLFKGSMITFYVSKRPGLDDFLRYVVENFHLVFFTAGPRSTSEPLVHRLINDAFAYQNRQPQYEAFYSDSITWEFDEYDTPIAYYKDLLKVERPLDRTILVDNTPYVFKVNPHNGLQISTWEGEVKHPNDVELIQLIYILDDFCRMDSLRAWREVYFPEETIKELSHEEGLSKKDDLAFTEVSDSQNDEEASFNEQIKKFSLDTDRKGSIDNSQNGLGRTLVAKNRTLNLCLDKLEEVPFNDTSKVIFSGLE